ncbi:hypothetical protein LAZ67_1005488, partial [Cordylochernes scorpioides]
MVETRSGKMQDPAQERIQAEESAKPQPGVTIGRDASSDPVVLNPNIDIPKYDGTEDPRPWIESLEEIGFLYHWADYIISRYAAMNMTGSAKTWLNLHKASFTSWENIKIRLIQDFSLDANKEELRMKLNRMQHWNEPAIRFAEDILVLCNKVDPAMEEETKIEHVIGGLKKEYSFALYLNPPKTTDDLLVVCKKMDSFEKKYRERVEKSRNLYNGPRYSRPQQQSRYVPPTAARNYQTTSRPQAPVSNNYKNDSHPTPRQYRNNFPQPSTPRRPYNPNFVPKPNLQRNTYNKSQEVSKNRTEDGRPICFKCNKPGHVARYCRVKFIRILEEDPADTQEKVEEKCQMNEISEKSGPRLYADIGTFEALVDTGADLSVVDLRTALDTGHGISKLAKICAGPDGKKLDMVGSIFLNIKIDDETLSHNFVILKTHLRTLILGRDVLKKMNAKIDCKQETIKYDLTNNHDEINFEMLKIKSAKDSIVPECSMKLIKALVETEDGEYIIEESSKMFQTNGLRLARSLINVINRETHIWITNPYPRPLKIMKNQTLAFGSSPAKINVSREREVEKNEEPRFQINENLSPKEQKELKQVLERYGDLFSSRLGRTNLAKHRIDTEDAKPIKHKPYRVSAKERDIIKEQIDEMLTEGIIRPSSSPWSFPVILVKKRDGKYRFCVDYRKLNNVTVKDVYPIPRIDEVMDTLQGSTHFSAIDLRSGYWQVEVEERDKEKTAFTTAHGLYEFNVMPFGLCNAPATFERNMENMLGNLRWQICLCYLDDVIIYSPDFPTHLKRLEAVFRCFRESNLRLNDKKCRFAFEELEILGYITSKHGIKPAEHNIKAVRNFPRPKKVKEVQSFLGMCSYYRKFIKDFSKIADPLTNLIKKSVSFTWTERQEEAFQTLKTALLSPPILGHFNPNAPTYVHTDASNIGIGATLVQDIGGEEKVILYLSRTLSKAEQNYSTTEKECLAVVWSMSKLRPYLYGRHFKIVTDHHALCWLKNLKDPTGRLARWALKIQEYDFDIIHKSGKKHLDADGLSRGPLPETDWDEDFERLFLNQITDEEDKFIESVKKNLNGSRRSIAQNFKEEDGCLFKKNPNPEGRAWLLVVPENKKREIMKEYHNHMSNGHLGVARTMYRIKSKYFWPSMLKDVSEFVRTCHLCQSRKGSNQLPSGLLQPIPPANFPFERIGIDFVGPLPSTKNRKKWIIVLSDYYTRYAETRAVSEATVKEVSKFLVEDIFLRHGAPQYLISDRGSQFTSNLMKEVMKTCKIKHCFTTSYHPQTNGLTERLNRTLINMLSMYVNTDQKNWDEILPFITHAYNTTIQETTGYSPFFLMFGREPTSLLDDRNISVDIDKDDYDEYIKHHLDKINRTRKLVINNTIKTQERMKKNYDKKHVERSYEPGELVAVWTPIRKIGKCEKLLRKYFGPYRILKKLSNVNYLIEPKDNPGQDPLIVHVSRIKPYFERIDEVNHEDTVRPRVARAPHFSLLASDESLINMPNSASPGSPGPAGQEPGRPSILSPTGSENSAKNEFHREIYREKSNSREYANPPADGGNVNLAVARGDVTSGLPPATSSNGAARALRNWADCPEDQGPGADDDFTVVRTKKRRRESANSPTAAAPSSNIGGARTSRRPQSSAGSVPRAQEIRTTRAHITEARARQTSSSEDLCVYLEHGPELQPFHYLRALDRMLGGTAGVIQVSKVNGHQLLGLANRGLAERLINEGLEVEGTLLRAFPFRKRAERITVGNLPFFVEDSAIISALKPYGRVTSIAPKLMKAGPYTYNDGRREAFIVLREGMTTERLPTRLEIPIKGEAWPAYLSSGIKCSRCHGQGHRRANCPLLAGRTNAPRPATPISPTSVPPVTAPGLPRQPSAHPPPPASPSPAMENPSASPAARAVTPSAAPRPSTPVAPAVPVEMAPPAPPPVTPAPSLRAPGGSVSPQSTKSGPPAQDIEMTAIEESSASSTSSSRTSMRDDLVAFIQRSPTVSFTGTDALGLGREEVLDLLSSRTKAQRKRGLLTPPQTDALAGLIEQILGLKPAGNTNVYKILHQVKSELKKGPAAVPPTPPLPAPRPAGPTPPVPHGVETKPAMATPPPPLPTPMEEEHVDHEDLMEDLFDELNSDTELKPLLDSGFSTYDLIEAILHRNERALLIAQLSPSQKIIFADEFQKYVNPPAGGQHANPAAPTNFDTASFSEAAAQANRSWADLAEDNNPEHEDNYTTVQRKKRRRGSAESPAAAAPSSNIRGAGAIRRPRSSTGWAPRAEEIRTTRAHIAEARARQASSTEDHCVYVERSPELEPFHYMRAIERMFGSTREVFQVTKMNGHFLVGLANRGMAERLVNEGLEVEGTLHRAFPFRKRAERITVGNLPFFVGDATVISALSAFGRVTSIAPKLMKAGPYIYNDGRREAFIILREGMTIEGLPTRLNITIKGEAWPAYLSSGIRCSRCRGQGHRRANCPLLAGRTNAPGPATPTSPTSVPPVTAPGLPQQPSAHPTPPASSSPAMEIPSASPAARAVTPSAAPRPSTPVAPAVPVEMAPPAPPPVTPAPSLRAPGGSVSPQSTKSGPPAQDIEMTAIEESSASSTSSSRTSMRDDLVAFIQRSPTVSFTGTDALGLGREEVLDLLSSRTKAQRKRGLLTPPQTDALAGLIEQILGLKPAGNTNVYKILHQVKSELKKGPAAVPPTPPLPAPRPAGPTPPVPHGVETKPAMATPPPPLPTPMEEEHTVRPRVARAPHFSLLASDESLINMPNSASPGSPGAAGQEPGRPSILPPTGSENSAKNEFHREIYREKSNSREYVNPPADGGNVNLAVARGDVTSGLPPATSSNGAARALRNWADCPEDQGPGADDDFTVVRTKKRRRESANSPTAAAPSSNIGGARTSRRPQSSAGSVPRAQEIRTTRAHITEARARQASSSEDLCVYLEHGPELQPFHYLRALDRMLGGTAGVIQVSKVNGHQLLGLANRGLAERLINEGLEVEGTLLRAFPFRKRAERITVGNLPFFVEDSAIISALKPYGRVTSIAPKLMKAGPYTYNDGRREAFIVLREGMTTERLPTRLEIPIKGEAWPAYLSSGIKCSRCHGQGHRRANCPLLAGRTNAPRPATPISPTSVPPVTAPGLPRQPSAHPPPPASPSPAMETPSASPAARAVTPSAAPRPSTPVAPAVPVEMAPPAPPPVTPAPSLRAPGGSVSPQSTKSGPPAQDIEMTAIEESSASSTSSSRTSMRDDLVAFIQRSPTVSFTGTDALGLGREEVLDLLSSRTKAQRKRGLLTPPQTDALAGLIEQILGLKPAGNTNVYKILHQVKSELKKGLAAVPPTPPLPAPRPAGPTPPVPHGVETKPAMATPPPPLPTPMEEEHVDHEDLMEDLFDELNSDTELKPLLDSGFS